MTWVFEFSFSTWVKFNKLCFFPYKIALVILIFNFSVMKFKKNLFSLY